MIQLSNYAKIKDFDIGNGDGIGVSIFLSGCDFKCDGCFNQELWNNATGALFDQTALVTLVEMVERDEIDHISILGGEPLSTHNVKTTKWIVHTLRNNPKTKNKKIWVWTGYEMMTMPYPTYHWVFKEKEIDYITLGQYEKNKRDLNRKYSGSTNQYTYDIKNDTIIEGGKY